MGIKECPFCGYAMPIFYSEKATDFTITVQLSIQKNFVFNVTCRHTLKVYGMSQDGNGGLGLFPFPLLTSLRNKYDYQRKTCLQPSATTKETR